MEPVALALVQTEQLEQIRHPEQFVKPVHILAALAVDQQPTALPALSQMALCTSQTTVALPTQHVPMAPIQMQRH